MKFKLVTRSIRDAEVDHILELASWGMSRRMIAKEVYGSVDDSMTDKSLARISHILRDYDVRVTDYRNSRNKEGKSMIVAIRREANVIDSIRAASKEMAAALSRRVG